MDNLKDKDFDRIRDELVKKNIILEELDTFLVEYNFKTQEIYIDPVKEKYITVPWDVDNIIQLRALEGVVFRPDIPAAKSFMDFKNVSPATKRRSITIRMFTEEHRYQWFRLSQICFFDENDVLEKVVVSITNTDEGTEIEQSLRFHSEKDPLTHLPNINAFQRKVVDLTQDSRNTQFSMIRMDVESFRVINDIFGSREGDKLLTFIGVRIQECLDEDSNAAYCRAASDVFYMCVSTKEYSVTSVIEFLRRAVTSYPCMYDISLAFGVYDITEDDIDCMTPVTTYIDRATAAQDTIKGNYLNHVAYYNEDLARQEKNERMILAEMQTALNEGQYKIYFQPKVDMITKRIVGAEALTRWIHPTKGLIPPGDYIPIFERNGFVVEHDEYIIRNVCSIIREWLDEGKPVYPISVNLSRTNLYNVQLVSHIEEYVSEYNIPRNLIEFELTESGFATDNNHLSALSKKLQTRGFRVYMDDFGSGYSSLNALREISVDVLKIDLRFLPTEKNDLKANTILKHVIWMAQDLNIDIVVEGVENAEQEEFLVKLGCKVAQGYYYYRPVKVEEYERKIMEELK